MTTCGARAWHEAWPRTGWAQRQRRPTPLPPRRNLPHTERGVRSDCRQAEHRDTPGGEWKTPCGQLASRAHTARSAMPSAMALQVQARSHLGTFARAQQESPEHSRHSPAWAPTLHLSHLWREVSHSVPLCVRQIPHLRQHSLGQQSGPFWVSGHLSILTEAPKEFSRMWILANDVYWI